MLDASLIAAKQAELQTQLAQWAADNSVLAPGQTLNVTITIGIVESPSVVVLIEDADEACFRRVNTYYLRRQLLATELDEIRCACANSIAVPLVSDILKNGNQGIGGAALIAIVSLLGKNRDNKMHTWSAYYDGLVCVNQILNRRRKPFRLTWDDVSGNDKDGPFRFYAIKQNA